MVNYDDLFDGLDDDLFSDYDLEEITEDFNDYEEEEEEEE